MSCSDARRFAAVALMLLSQLAGGMVVICNAGVGGQILEIAPQACCGTEDEPASERPDQDADRDPYDRCCVDVPMVPFHQVGKDLLERGPFELTVVATLPATPLPLLIRGAPARDSAPPGALPTAARLTGSVVRLC